MLLQLSIIMLSRGFVTEMFNISEALGLFQFPKYVFGLD